MLKWLITFFFLFILSVQSFAGDFDRVDKYARSINRSGNYKQLARKLTNRFSNEKDKARAIYVWITDNIKYDWTKFQYNLKGGGKYYIKGRSKAEISQKRRKIKEKKINNVFRSGKGVCEDYAMLFKAMCDEIGLESIIVNGKIKVNPEKIGIFPNRSSHAWNTVKINNKWYLVDATWGAGYVEAGIFHKKFEDGFFMTDPQIFILNHYPNDPKWQLLDKSVCKKEFADFVFVHFTFFDSNIIDFSPKNGFLNTKNKYSIIKLIFKNKPLDIYLYYNKKLKKIDFIKEGNKLELKVPTRATNQGVVELVVKNGNRILPLLEYKIK